MQAEERGERKRVDAVLTVDCERVHPALLLRVQAPSRRLHLQPRVVPRPADNQVSMHMNARTAQAAARLHECALLFDSHSSLALACDGPCALLLSDGWCGACLAVACCWSSDWKS